MDLRKDRDVMLDLCVSGLVVVFSLPIGSRLISSSVCFFDFVRVALERLCIVDGIEDNPYNASNRPRNLSARRRESLRDCPIPRLWLCLLGARDLGLE